ncbi:MAG TPA: T9SS type A sorting domain-containing protein [Chitinophagales bacterium]|nr:T9SS type A sorting domain-containing protein [Chitinophagales bacterium]HNA57974.1 T9SS type A sorting domain-containing protein [Chitinophagales bacterium]HNE47180.1 T9SS type A sorting domain-containing protein [Chitinophagales bacterium]HNF68760.1 T9SS type A sorting domain-containing protein [Chitinophagales bacterium]HNI54098.1 T9SS type A sorting domain-containing protein [Chitinophagales bacterium]
MLNLLTKHATAALLLAIPFNLFAQAPAIEWQNTIGGTGYDFLNTISQTSDGGFIMGGYSASGIGGDKSEDNWGGDDYWIVKLNADGTIAWENTIGGGNFDRLYSVEETADGGYILGGQSLSGGGWGDKSESNMGGYDYWVVKVNALGVVQWDNTIGGTGNDQLYNAQPTSDGGYILAGTSDSGISGDKTENRVGNSDYWLVKLNSSGSIVWQNDIGGVMFENLYSAYETTDGGFILGGTSTSGISGDKTAANIGGVDYWIVKVNASGTLVWEKTIGSTGSDYVYTCIATADGGSLAVGMSDGIANGNKTEAANGLFDYWLVKLDNSGNITWQNSIGGTGNDYTFVDAGFQQNDGNYLIAGYSQSTISGDKTEANTGSWDYWILQLNSTGNILWQSVVGGSSGDYANSIGTTFDGGVIVGGYSYSNAGGEKTENSIGDADYWVVRYEGNCVPTSEICNGLDDDCDGAIDESIAMFATAYATGPTTFCQGGSVVLNSSYSGDDVQWMKNGVNIPGATSASYTATQKGSYSIITTTDCGAAVSAVVYVNVNKNPSASISASGPTSFCAGGSVTLTEVPTAGCTYQWFKGAVPIAGATSTSYVATMAGNYKCRVTKTATGCLKNSNAIAVTIVCKESVEIGLTLTVSPNPASDYIDIISTNSKHADITIVDAIGRVVLTEMLEEGFISVDVSKLPAGIYYVRCLAGSEISTVRFVKQ